MKTNFQTLHEKALQITKTYLRAESDLISILQAIEDCRGYRELSYRSLFEYSRQALGLSEAVSYNLITVARKAKVVPMLQEKLRTQEITLSNAKMIAPVLTSENQNQWLSAAATLSKRELEKEIAKEFPEKQIQEQTRYVSENRIELKLGISEELYEMLKRIQDIASSQSQNALNLEQTLQEMAEVYLEKKDPIKKAERAQKRTSPKPVPGQESSNPRFIPASVQHAVRLRDHGQCSFLNSNGKRCDEKRWLDFHHIQPVSEGGQSNLENLRLLCRGHHQVVHLQTEMHFH
jgi:hypothetical protein